MKKLLAILLAVCLLVGAVPMAASAADGDFTIEGGVLKKYVGPGGDVVIPDGVTGIGAFAFDGCTSLTSVIIPDDVTEIGAFAFGSCTSLTSVTIPDSVTDIGMSAFQGCTNLISVTIPNDVTTIGAFAFDGCINLTSATIPNGVSSIEVYTFSNCTSLTSVTIPGTVTRIRDCAFYRCKVLKDVYYPGTEAEWKQITIGKSNECLTSATIHYNSTSIPTPPTPPTPPKPTVGGFKDVFEGDYCADAVVWAVNSGVTTGKGSGKFAPNDSCTRGEIVTFLWRAAGQPEPTTTENPFADVKEGDFFYKPVLWAAENNVTGGTGVNADGKAVFSPGNSCTRAQAMTFQWRAAGKPTSSTSGTFADVPSGSYYADAVSWALENEITNGTGGGKFGSGNSCTRGQIVTFLYRGRDVA